MVKNFCKVLNMCAKKVLTFFNAEYKKYFENVYKFFKLIQFLNQFCKKNSAVKIFANCKVNLIFNPCAILYQQLFLRLVKLSRYSYHFKKYRCDKKFNFKTQNNNQFVYKSKRCRAAKEFRKFSKKRKADLASIAGGRVCGLLTGDLGSVNP